MMYQPDIHDEFDYLTWFSHPRCNRTNCQVASLRKSKKTASQAIETDTEIINKPRIRQQYLLSFEYDMFHRQRRPRKGLHWRM